jgi:hypothetical protein
MGLENLMDMVRNSKLAQESMVVELNKFGVGVGIDKDMRVVIEFAEECVPRVDVAGGPSALTVWALLPTSRQEDMRNTAEAATETHCWTNCRG